MSLNALRGIELDAGEVEQVFQSLTQHRNDLEQYQSWLKSKDGQTLPGAEIAVVEIGKELMTFRNLISKIYMNCFV